MISQSVGSEMVDTLNDQLRKGGSIPTPTCSKLFKDCISFIPHRKQYTTDFTAQFEIGLISPERAIDLNRVWHSHMPIYRTGYSVMQHCKVCYGAIFENMFYAVAIWSHPNARNLPQHTWLELRRMAISGDAPKEHGKPNDKNYGIRYR